MASRIASILRMMPLLGGAGKAALPPNSWAYVSIWRRFFELQEEEQEETIQIMAEVLEESASEENARPVASEENARARAEYVKEYYRTLVSNTKTNAGAGRVMSTGASSGSSGSSRSSEVTPAMQERERQQLYDPNLDIPTEDGQSYVTLAQ
eukprot:CAMPEP_0185724476 /NCGR_PEP_ID=MMETSP1171-20130828/947_1 /TAXON_ID=374046 /ORGANISM="Helicotheca tamensis, Strain CCMP826" /LENGTH=151 /DNA_ID=CAMNT_0028392335 /DNA_START=116 /DNA_END=571 /DNA_ORIENTATION=-